MTPGSGKNGQVMIGIRGLLQNRKRNSQKGNRSMNKGKTDLEKLIKKMMDHNLHTRRQRGKYQTMYYERNPEKLDEEMAKEEEKRKAREEKEIKKAREPKPPRIKPKNSVKQTIKNMNNLSDLPATKRSISLGARNQTFRSNNLSFTKNKLPPNRGLNDSSDLLVKPLKVEKKLSSIRQKKPQYASLNHVPSTHSENKENLTCLPLGPNKKTPKIP